MRGERVLEFVEDGKKYTASRGLLCCRDVKTGNVELEAFDVFVNEEPTKEKVLHFANVMAKIFKEEYKNDNQRIEKT